MRTLSRVLNGARRLLKRLGQDVSASSRDRSRLRHIVTLGDVTVQFSTEDAYSRSWFYPRYADRRLHERPVTEMLIGALRDSQCFADVGTNLGWYTCIASRLMRNGKVYGFEMDAHNFARLQNNVVLNGCRNVELHHVAVSDSPGAITYKREGHPSMYRMIDGSADTGGLVSVQSITLDGFFQDRGLVPDVLKIDVEGAEMNVLRGMRRILTECRPTLFLEIHPANLTHLNSSTAEIIGTLRDLGYEVYEIEELRAQRAGGQLRPVHRDSPLTANSMLYASVA